MSELIQIQVCNLQLGDINREGQMVINLEPDHILTLVTWDDGFQSILSSQTVVEVVRAR